MRAAFLEKPKQISIKYTETPEPKVGEVRVKLKQVGICGSDVHLFQGHRPIPYPSIIGHEGLGYIDKIGEGVEGRFLGERVVIEPNIPCGKCRYCQNGRGVICINKRVIGLNEWGCFAEYVVLPSAFAWPIPPLMPFSSSRQGRTVSDDDAVTIEPTAVAFHALKTTKAYEGDAIAVIGLGAIGLLVAHMALRLGYTVFVTEINVDKVKLIEKQGAIPLCPTGTLEEQTGILAKTWFENNVSAIFECAGAGDTTTLAIAAAPRGSEVILLGLSSKPAMFTPLKVVRESVSIIPSIIYDHPFDFQNTINLIESKTIQPNFIISKYIPFDDLQIAMEMASLGNESKIVITF